MKKALKYILVVLVIVSMLSTMAVAVKPQPPDEPYISRGEYYKLTTMINLANLKIQLCVAVAQLTPWNDVAWLVAQDKAITRQVLDYAESIGASTAVQCVYETYTVDGVEVLIDPIIYIPIAIWP
jgi:hypothetical protein